MAVDQAPCNATQMRSLVTFVDDAPISLSLCHFLVILPGRHSNVGICMWGIERIAYGTAGRCPLGMSINVPSLLLIVCSVWRCGGTSLWRNPSRSIRPLASMSSGECRSHSLWIRTQVAAGLTLTPRRFNSFLTDDRSSS